MCCSLKLPEFTCSPGLAWNPPLSPASPGECTCSSQGSSGPSPLPAAVNNLLVHSARSWRPRWVTHPWHCSPSTLPSLAGFVNLIALAWKNIYSLGCFSSRACPDKSKRVICVQSNAQVCKAARFKSMSTHTHKVSNTNTCRNSAFEKTTSCLLFAVLWSRAEYTKPLWFHSRTGVFCSVHWVQQGWVSVCLL